MSHSRPFPCYDGSCYDVSQSVGHQLVNLITLMRRVVEQRMAAHGLTDAQWKPLWLLDSGRASTANELARVLDMDAGAVTRLLDRLEAKALLERVRSDEDRRIVRLRLTEAGRTAVAVVPHVLAGVNNDLLRGFSEADWLQLQDLIARMTANGVALNQNPEAA